MGTDKRSYAPQGRRGAGGVDSFGDGSVHSAGRAACRLDDVDVRRGQRWDGGVDVERRSTPGAMEKSEWRHESGDRWRAAVRVRSRRRATGLHAGDRAARYETRLWRRSLEQPDRGRWDGRASRGKLESTSDVRRARYLAGAVIVNGHGDEIQVRQLRCYSLLTANNLTTLPATRFSLRAIR